MSTHPGSRPSSVSAGVASVAVLFAALGLIGCASDDDPSAETSVPATTAPVTTAPITTAPATMATASTAPVTTAVPATTTPPITEPVPPAAFSASTDATAEIRALIPTPGPVVARAHQLTEAVAAMLLAAAPECEVAPTTSTSTTVGEPAIGTILVDTGCDDSVGGTRYVLTMEGDDSSGWGVASATRESLCRRGVSVTDPLLCV